MSIECGLPTVSVWQLLKGAYNLLKDPVVYAMSSKSFFDSLKEEVGKLENEARRVEALAQAARNNLRNLNEVFTEWKKRADKASEDARNRWEAFEDSKSCCYGRLPNPYCHYKFSTEAEAEIKVIRDLAQESIRFRGVDDICLVGTAPAPTPARREGKDVVQPTTAAASILSASMSVKLRDHDVFESRFSMIRNIMDALADNSKSVVGVYGMGGVGKSTLLEDVKRILIEERSFDRVAKADVSKNPDIKTIQGEIADAFDLTDIKNKETIPGRAELLHRRLKEEESNKKKVLIILDNLWEKLDLKSVGIPCGHDNKAIGCKLLLTSRHQHLLQREMGCDREFLLGELEKEEARALFERTVGDKVRDNEFKPWVEVALHRCAGVPFLIVAMGKLLKCAALYEWKDTLKKIEKFNHREINGLIDHMLQWSYDGLEGEAKSLLRLCVVYSVSKPSLENLVRYGFGLGLFRGVRSMEEAGDRLRSHIRALQASALLLDSEDVGDFKIHDLVREFVALASSRDHHPLIVLDDKVKSITQLPEDELESCEAMCFSNMKELPPELNCPELRILLMSTNDASLHIPDSYFNSMRNLMVLNLARVGLTRSPSPFQLLANVHTLCFQNCSFEDVAILGNLKGLEIFSIVDSEIQRLPKEIGQLVKLRSLDLSRCSNLEIIEPGVLQSLTNLEELYLKQSFHHWSAGEQTQPTNASLSELNHMKKLCTLHVSIPDPRVLPDDLYVEKLTKYEIRIGEEWRRWWNGCNGSRTLELELGPFRDVLQKVCIKSILDKTNDLLLSRLDGSEQSICALSRKGFPELKHLQVKNSPSVRYILECPSLPALETLLLENLINLEKIYHNHISIESFSTLKVVRVEGCDKMEVLFPRSVVRQLPHLEEIKVVDCELMRGIVEADDDRSKLELPKLRVLELLQLPNITNFFSAGSSPSRSTSDNQVGTQIAFFNGQQVDFSRLETLEISDLGNLRFMFFPSMVKSLIKLRKLSIRNCKMEAIVMEEEGLGMEASKNLAFPMLSDLCLNDLGRLTWIHPRSTNDDILFIQQKNNAGSQEARSQDNVQSCSTALFNREVAFPSLETLDITGMDNIKMIWDNQAAADSFPKLKSLCVDGCNKLKCVWDKELHHQVNFRCLHSISVSSCKSLASLFPASIVRDLTQLEELEIRGCGIAELIEKDEGGTFPNLQEFKLDLYERMEIWHGDFHDEEFFRKLRVLELRRLSKESTTSTSRFIESLTNLEELIVRESYLEEPSSNVEASEGPSQEQMIILPFSRQIKHLKALNVSDCGGLSSMFTPTIAENLVALTKLRISNCGILTEVISDKGSKEGHEVAFHHPKCMELDGLIELKCFGSATVAKAKFVRLFEFPELVGKWHNEHNPVNSSWQLETLVVDKCPSFINAMPSKLMLVLEKMTILQVRDCESLEEIFNLQGLEAVESTRVLPRLENLNFLNLPKLRQLWNKDLQGTMRFNALSSLTLYKCSNLRHAFTPSMAWCLANLEYMEIKECDQMEGVIEEKEGQGSAMEKIMFPRLGQMILKWLPNLTSFLSGKNHALDCPKLYYLRIAHCPKMRSLMWQSSMDIDHNTPSLFTPRVQFLRLRCMVLSHMDNLSKIWPDNPQETLTFDSLLEVKVKNCESLENLFPYWVATSLTQLGKLRVESCRIEEIVTNGDDTRHSNIAQVLFPKLMSLVLHDMTRLKTFCPNLPTLNWQFLEELRVTHCDKPNMLSFAASMSEWTQRNDQQDLSNQEAHSSFERDFPNLNRLLLVAKDIRMIRNGKFPDDIFGKPKALTLACFQDEKATFPPSFLIERFQNMESPEIFRSSFEDIFPAGGIVDEGKHPVLESLRKLKLSKLHKLKRVWREDFQVPKILPSIETLEVRDCPELTILFPAVTSFQNLTKLVVKNSPGLATLSSTHHIGSRLHPCKGFFARAEHGFCSSSSLLEKRRKRDAGYGTAESRQSSLRQLHTLLTSFLRRAFARETILCREISAYFMLVDGDDIVFEVSKLEKYSGKQANCDCQVIRQAMDGEAEVLWTRSGHFSAGLHAEDVCVFTLIDRDDVVCRVYMFTSAGNTKEVHEKYGENLSKGMLLRVLNSPIIWLAEVEKCDEMVAMLVDEFDITKAFLMLCLRLLQETRVFEPIRRDDIMFGLSIFRTTDKTWVNKAMQQDAAEEALL
ncbi:uncharacterized protein LOC115732916 [Rhodamnia argentea]|uniref:Uncharacterized protein LOC115732916 n=1 Tax=Rhodamnia argentea TaxID=178133 RepID=A0ABM3HGM7_9MYRT|nr:uncharacterized protein LOC115732916 [Rhodamnia argentea]